MAWLSLINALASLASMIVEYAKNNKLIDAGIAMKMNDDLKSTLEAVKDAQALRGNLTYDERKRLFSKYRRNP